MKTIKLKDILSISGIGGLFRFVAQARNGIVVESIEDGKRHVAPATARVSSLVDIAIFTDGEEIPLSDVFMKIHENSDGKAAISHKASPEELRAAFSELVPDYDEEKVYVSDIRKVFQWYNQLLAHEMLEVIDKEEETEGEAAEEKESDKTKDTARPKDAPRPKETPKPKDTPRLKDSSRAKNTVKGRGTNKTGI
jgi:hypothetical protein